MKPEQSRFETSFTSDDWFEVNKLTDDIFAFRETRHYENPVVHLIVGREKAVLIDTGCGIGNLRNAVEAITDKPVMVINTHTHSDHLGSNYQFNEIVMFDHPLSRRVSAEGRSHDTVQVELLEDNLVTEPWPRDFDRDAFSIPPFPVSRWIKDGEEIDLGDRTLQAIFTPGEAQDHICLLDRTHRLLFCGDVLIQGPLWTHLPGGSVKELAASLRKLTGFFDAFDHLMPGHNEPWLDKHLLPDTLAGCDAVLSGDAPFREIVDPWNRNLREYSFGQFQIWTRQSL
jgi:glyoxylase-like metal-dependent hydrolase (beta-lactamase superfamily II)